MNGEPRAGRWWVESSPPVYHRDVPFVRSFVRCRPPPPPFTRYVGFVGSGMFLQVALRQGYIFIVFLSETERTKEGTKQWYICRDGLAGVGEGNPSRRQRTTKIPNEPRNERTNESHIYIYIYMWLVGWLVGWFDCSLVVYCDETFKRPIRNTGRHLSVGIRLVGVGNDPNEATEMRFVLGR
jgi:hypothetical protein